MKKKLASIEIVSAVTPADNSTNLELITLAGLGWQIVAKKGLHKVGDKVVFVIIDTVIQRRPWCEFLFVNGKGVKQPDTVKEIQIQSVRLRGNVSQGIVIPIKEVPEASRLIPLKVGKDYSKRFGVRKYQKPSSIEAENNRSSRFSQIIRKILWKLGFGWLLVKAGYAKPPKLSKPFPAFLTKTDEDNLQGVPGILEDFKNPENGGIYITLKCDGSSGSIYNSVKPEQMGVASRNVDLDIEASNEFTDAYCKNILKVAPGTCVQGEVVGPGIQKNKMGFEEKQFILFQVVDIQTGNILDYDDFVKYAEERGFNRADEIPVPEGWQNFTVKDWFEFASKAAKYKGGVPGEGIVIRTKKNINANRRGSHCGRLSAKVINPDYKL